VHHAIKIYKCACRGLAFCSSSLYSRKKHSWKKVLLNVSPVRRGRGEHNSNVLSPVAQSPGYHSTAAWSCHPATMYVGGKQSDAPDFIPNIPYTVHRKSLLLSRRDVKRISTLMREMLRNVYDDHVRNETGTALLAATFGSTIMTSASLCNYKVHIQSCRIGRRCGETKENLTILVPV